MLSSVWFQAVMNGVVRKDSVTRVLGPEWRDRDAFAVGLELFRRLLAHPEGIEVAELDMDANLDESIGFEDGKIRLMPEDIMAELGRAVYNPAGRRPGLPLCAGLRPANPLDRQYHSARPRAGARAAVPHCALNLSPGDAQRMGVIDGDTDSAAYPAGTGRTAGRCGQKTDGGACLDAERFRHDLSDRGQRVEHANLNGVNMNAYTDTAARDPFTGCPYHRFVSVSD